MAENKENRGFIHEEDTSQVAELKKTLDCHIKAQEVNDIKMTNDIQCNKI